MVVSQTGARQRKRTDRSLRQRSDQALDKTAPNTPSTSADLSKTAEMSGTLTKDGRRSHDLEEGEEDMEERMRQEERDKELKTLELLERRIGIEDGSLKRLGGSLKIIRALGADNLHSYPDSDLISQPSVSLNTEIV